jgi:hypothetical protein
VRLVREGRQANEEEGLMGMVGPEEAGVPSRVQGAPEGAKLGSAWEDAIIYQLEKVNQGGEVEELFEAQKAYVAKNFGLDIDEESCDLILPGNRRATLTMMAVIYKEDN